MLFRSLAAAGPGGVIGEGFLRPARPGGGEQDGEDEERGTSFKE